MEGLSEYLVTSYIAATSRQVTKAMALALSQKARPGASCQASFVSRVQANQRASRAAQETAAAEMRRVRATRRAAALRVALAALTGGGAAAGSADDGDADALVARLLRDGEAAQPAWLPTERARMMRARQWTCLLARDDTGALLGWCAFLGVDLPLIDWL